MVDIRNAQAGEVVGALVTQPITRHTLALYCGASSDHNPIHVDIDFARAAGMPDVFAHGMLSMAYLGRLVTRLAPQSAVQSLSARFTSIVQVGAEIACRAELIERIVQNGKQCARLRLVAVDQNDDVKLVGEAVLILHGEQNHRQD